MPSVGVNPPKTPVTDGNNGVAAATLPNVCKMPGPPAPFVPVPLPNIGKSGDSPKGYSTSVKIEGNKVAIKGATFKSMGDMASKGTGGGIVSMNTHGPTSFVGPGSMDVKIEGKNVQLLSDPMLNNNGPSGSPPNSATMMGILVPMSALPPGDGDLTCPHNRMWRSAPGEGAQDLQDAKRKDLAKIEQQRAILRRANRIQGSNPAGARRLENILRGSTVNAATAQFEEDVAARENARESAIRFRCLDCGMDGDIDVVTKDGVVKECKISSGAANLTQINKIRSAAGKLFPGAPVHFALPSSEAPKAKRWMKRPPNKVQAH